MRVGISILLITTSAFAGTIIHVPADQPTIQAGINAASNGDTVLVAPGTYYENINFNGKEITVISAKGPVVTTIDGNQAGAVVSFVSRETKAKIIGFTIRNGGGGVSIRSAAPCRWCKISSPRIKVQDSLGLVSEPRDLWETPMRTDTWGVLRGFQSRSVRA